MGTPALPRLRRAPPSRWSLLPTSRPSPPSSTRWLATGYWLLGTIGFLRQAEIKHGRVAMAAFVGYCVQSNGVYFPWSLTGSGITHANISAAGSPPEQWDA